MPIDNTSNNANQSHIATPENKNMRLVYHDEVKNAARSLFLRRYKVREIAETLHVPERTVYDWSIKGGWLDLLNHEGPDEAINRRLSVLVERNNKSAADLKEIDLLISSQERRLRMREREKTNTAQARDEESGAGNSFAEAKPKPDKRSQKKKNDVSRLTTEDFQKRLHSNYFGYQRDMRAELLRRNRYYLKARQIGATWYFAQEAFENAVLTGDNQIFLSATKAQSLIFRQYILDICGQAFDISLSGNPLVLHTAHGPATLYFLATSSRSAQGYHGHVYGDEFFWIPKFREFFKVASGMAAHAKWRRTLFSTPSIITHEAYPLWSGKQYLSRFKNPKPWPEVKALRLGLVCPDNAYRKIITLDDAEHSGCNLFNRAELELEYSPEEFRQLFGCEFIDDTHAVFPLNVLEPCMEDPDTWDIDLNRARPVGDTGVWGGYDPSRNRDDASFVVLLPPQKAGEKIRMLERHTWKGQSYLYQVARIKELRVKYRFTHMGVDVTGPGQAVLENVRQFCPVAMPITYSIMSKAALVHKAQEVIAQNRLAWDAAQTDISHAFMTIRQVSTPSGQITYAAHRTDTTGHADVAWATMHALAAEPLARTTNPGGKRSALTFSEVG